MWETDESDLMEEMESLARSMFEEIYSGSIDWLFDMKKNHLRPLYRVQLKGKELLVTFDLPGVEKKDISISATRDTVSVEAKTRKPISLMVGGSFQKRVEFENYSESIKLPVAIDPDKAKASVRNGLLTVRFPLAPRGTKILVK